MNGWTGLSYPAIASFKVPLQGGNRSPNVFSKCAQSKAEKSGRVAGVGKSSLRPGSMVSTVCSERCGSLARICCAHSYREVYPLPAKWYIPHCSWIRSYRFSWFRASSRPVISASMRAHVGLPTWSSTIFNILFLRAQPSTLLTKLLPRKLYTQLARKIKKASLACFIFSSPINLLFPYTFNGLVGSVSVYVRFRSEERRVGK